MFSNFFKVTIALLPLLCLGCLQTSAQGRQAQLKALFDTLGQRNNLNGCVLIMDRGKVLLQTALGSAGDGKERLLTNESIFEIGSSTKGFTAMGIMQLKEKALLSYEDSPGKFFPELHYPGVRIKHLLSHTSGIEDFLAWTEQDIDVSRIHSNADIIQKLSEKNRPAVFTAGEGVRYSNTNYLLLASIIELASGMPFDEYLRD